MSKAKSIVILTLMSIVIVIVALMCFVSTAVPGSIKDYNSILSLVGKGIDLSGGYYIVLQPENASEGTNESVINDAMEILRARLDDKGYTESVISLQNGSSIRIEIPEISDEEDVLKTIGQTGELTFKDYAGKVWLNGEDHIDSAYVAYDDNAAAYVVVLKFTTAGVSRFSEATKAISAYTDDKKLYIYLGDTVVSQPSVSSQITSTSAQIESFETYEEAQSIAAVIDSGKLPIDYVVLESGAMSATLGENAINNSVIAAGIGLLLIFLFMIIFYRGFGIAADLALIIYTLAYIILLAIIPSVQLTLPGIAGIILSIGMAVDSNIIIFERIKEIYREQSTIDKAINDSFAFGVYFNRKERKVTKSAVKTVLDSNITTILAAIVLWILCPGTIKGFAITLLIGIVLSMFTAIFITRGIIKLLLAFYQNDRKKLDEERAAKFLNLKRDSETNNSSAVEGGTVNA